MTGKIEQISGSVVDVVFETGKLPKIKDASSFDFCLFFPAWPCGSSALLYCVPACDGRPGNTNGV